MADNRATNEELGGMSLNERLVVCGLLARWDEAVRRGNREEVIAVLRRVALTGEQAAQTADAVLRNPKMYGL